LTNVLSAFKKKKKLKLWQIHLCARLVKMRNLKAPNPIATVAKHKRTHKV
jgi:hypothetical protein